MTKSSVFEREDDIVELGRGKCIENEGGETFLYFFTYVIFQ